LILAIPFYKGHSLGEKLKAISNLVIVVLYGLFTFTQIWLLFFASVLTVFTFLVGIGLSRKSEFLGVQGHALYHVVAFVFMLPVAFLGWEAFYLGSLFILGFVIIFPVVAQ